jgi:hypothetical protein
MDHRDRQFTTGRIGLWTNADFIIFRQPGDNAGRC